MTLSDWIIKEDLTAAEVARRLNVSHSTVGRWCTAKLFPSRDSLIAIQSVTGGCVTANDFMPVSADEVASV